MYQPDDNWSNRLDIHNLRYNNIDAEGARALAEALRENTSLQSLDLSYNAVGVEGARTLAEALRENASLQSLCLGYNRCGVEGARELLEALKVNTSLQSLKVEWGEYEKLAETLLERNRCQSDTKPARLIPF